MGGEGAAADELGSEAGCRLAAESEKDRFYQPRIPTPTGAGYEDTDGQARFWDTTADF